MNSETYITMMKVWAKKKQEMALGLRNTKSPVVDLSPTYVPW
jgi:hypothetical protein